jgi:hypothetical protein
MPSRVGHDRRAHNVRGLPRSRQQRSERIMSAVAVIFAVVLVLNAARSYRKAVR